MASEHFTIEIEDREPASVVIHLRGEADGANAEHLSEHLYPVLDRDPIRVVLNLADLEFINSLGLGALIEFRNELASRGGQLRLAGATASVLEVLRKTRLNELFPLFDDTESALIP